MRGRLGAALMSNLTVGVMAVILNCEDILHCRGFFIHPDVASGLVVKALGRMGRGGRARLIGWVGGGWWGYCPGWGLGEQGRYGGRFRRVII